MKTPYWFLKKTPMALILWPLSIMYYGVSRLVFKIKGMHPYKSNRPVICVGNILAGGVGKTPIVREIATFFDSPVVMRGYKQDIKNGRTSDEAVMLARSGLQVHTGNRKSNLILLNKQKNDKTPIVMDDGFQNSSIYKDVSIVVFDESIGMGNKLLLPAGPLREPRSALARADAFVIVKPNNKKVNLELPVDKPMFFAENVTVVPYKKEQKLVAFAGIGYPKKFFDCLTNVVVKRAYPDHYQYTDKDIKELLDLADKHGAKLITTEKDWVRLPQYAQDKIKYAELDTKIEDKFFDWLKERVN